MLTLGIDVGSSAVKATLVRTSAGCESQILANASERYRRRTPHVVVAQATDRVLADAGATWDDVAYTATTGDGDLAPRRDGHFYGMTTHARGALFLDARTRSVLDCGALHARAIRTDERGKVLSYRMTSQCASGSGQFIENIARYLGVALADVGRLSAEAQSAEPVSGICAVLAETDVINMVARGVPAAAILRGIHESVAARLTKLLKLCRADSPVCLTGGLSADTGLLAALRAQLTKDGSPLEIIAPANGIQAGALGAALWGAHRARMESHVPAREVVHAP